MEIKYPVGDLSIEKKCNLHSLSRRDAIADISFFANYIVGELTGELPVILKCLIVRLHAEIE